MWVSVRVSRGFHPKIPKKKSFRSSEGSGDVGQELSPRIECVLVRKCGLERVLSGSNSGVISAI